MLETIREYALERLRASGEESAVRRAHAAFCLVLAEEGNPESDAADRAVWLTRCDVEIDNFRFALDWLIENQQLEWGLRLSIALVRFWDMREHLLEGRSRLETILRLAAPGYAKERAKVSLFLGAITTSQGDFLSAKGFVEQSHRIYEELGDEWGIAVSLNAIAVSARDRGDYATAQYNFERSLACLRRLPDRAAIARSLHNLANLAKARKDYVRAQDALREATSIFEEIGDRTGAAWSINQQGDIAREEGEAAVARELYRQALAVFREAGDRWGSARSLADLGAIHCEHGEYGAAHAAYRDALQIFTDLGHKRGVARALEGFACLAAASGHALRALQLAAAANHLRQQISARLPQTEQSKLDLSLRLAWDALGEKEGKRAWAAGSAMSLEQAVLLSMEEPETVISHSRDQ